MKLRSFAVILPVVLVAAPLLAQRGAARPQVTRPDGPVWTVIRQNCSGCHGIDDYAFYALDKPGWQDLIATKHKDHNVTLTSENRDLLLDWLVSKFGPASKPFPRTYIPPEITTYFTDLEATRFLGRACSNCHDLEIVNNSRFAADRWRVVLLTMRERGAVLNDEELERMVEWLGRVKGINPNQ